MLQGNVKIYFYILSKLLVGVFQMCVNLNNVNMLFKTEN